MILVTDEYKRINKLKIPNNLNESCKTVPETLIKKGSITVFQRIFEHILAINSTL